MNTKHSFTAILGAAALTAGAALLPLSPSTANAGEEVCGNVGSCNNKIQSPWFETSGVGKYGSKPSIN